MNTYLVEARLPPFVVECALNDGADVLSAALAGAVNACGGEIDALFFRGSDLGLLAVVLLPDSSAAMQLLVLLAANDAISSPELARLTPALQVGPDGGEAPVFLIRVKPQTVAQADPFKIVAEAVSENSGYLVGLYEVGSGGELLAWAMLPNAAAVAAQLRANPVFNTFYLGRALTRENVAAALAAAGTARAKAALQALPGSSCAPPSA